MTVGKDNGLGNKEGRNICEGLMRWDNWMGNL